MKFSFSDILRHSTQICFKLIISTGWVFCLFDVSFCIPMSSQLQCNKLSGGDSSTHNWSLSNYAYPHRITDYYKLWRTCQCHVVGLMILFTVVNGNKPADAFSNSDWYAVGRKISISKIVSFPIDQLLQLTKIFFSDLHQQTKQLWPPLPTSPSWGTPNDVTQVILVAYFRSGSGLTGEILNHYNGAFYLFEPLRGITRSLYGSIRGFRLVHTKY